MKSWSETNHENRPNSLKNRFNRDTADKASKFVNLFARRTQYIRKNCSKCFPQPLHPSLLAKAGKISKMLQAHVLQKTREREREGSRESEYQVARRYYNHHEGKKKREEKR